MTALNESREKDSALATYWFATLAAAVDRHDYILANEARDHLHRLGFDVQQFETPRNRKPKGGAR